MGQYSAANIPNSIAPGDIIAVWGTMTNGVLSGGEQPVAGAGGASASLQVAIVPGIQSGASLHFHGQFSAAPGAFEVDCQVADIDADSSYQTLSGGNITTVDATNSTFHFETISEARFARMLLRTRTNAVNVTGTIGR